VSLKVISLLQAFSCAIFVFVACCTHGHFAFAELLVIQYWRVKDRWMDGQTDRQTDGHMTTDMLLFLVQTLLDLSGSSLVRSDALSFEGSIIPCENSANVNNNVLLTY